MLFCRTVCYTQSTLVASFTCVHLDHLDSRRVMLKRFISASLLLFVVAVQAFAADCELRCATMTANFGHHGCGHAVRAEPKSMHLAHCHGMSMKSDAENSSATGTDHCQGSVCKFQSDAIAKQPGANVFNFQAPVVILPEQSLRDLAAASSARATVYRPRNRQEIRAPLDLRPGSSLRI